MLHVNNLNEHVVGVMRRMGVKTIKEAHGNNPGAEEFGAGAEQPKAKKPDNFEYRKPAIRKAIKDYEDKLKRIGDKHPDAQSVRNGIAHYKKVLSGEINEHDISPDSPQIENQPPGHDEAKEIAEDPTREKLETAKDEADERKGGAAELAADLRVSVRIETMNLNRYKRMADKHDLSEEGQAWLKEKISQIQDCIDDMKDRIPKLEAEAAEQSGDEEKSQEEITENFKTGIRKAVFEIVSGQH